MTLSVEDEDYWSYGVVHNRLQEKLDELGKAGWDVFSCIVPDSYKYTTFRLMAKRPIRHAANDGRKFR